MPGSLDADLYLATISRMRAGEPYYQALGREQVARRYPTKPVFAWRLPTLLTLEAALPSIGWSIVLLSLVGLGSALLWWRHFPEVGPARELVMALLLFTTLPTWAWLAHRNVTLHDLWAGDLIALSLALWASERPGWSVGAAACALAIRELTLPFVFVMAAMAWLEGRRRESLAWMGLVVAFGAGLAWHARRVAANLPPGGYANSWAVSGGWCFGLATTRTNILLLEMPAWLLAIVVPAMLFALWTWRSPVGRRVALVVTLYFGVFSVVGRPFNWYWGLLVEPILPLGVAFQIAHWRPKRLTRRSIAFL